jgi:DivIVA domain-containing protein
MTAPTGGAKFPRRPWWAPGYLSSEVDALVDRIEATLAGRIVWSGDAVTAEEVRQAKFRTTWREGYDEEMVDEALDSYAHQLNSVAE